MSNSDAHDDPTWRGGMVRPAGTVVPAGHSLTGTVVAMGKVAAGVPIATGGSGLVLSGTQARLGRELALKVARQDSPQAHAELVLEARVTGYLDHPNIVPVHGLAADSSGRPVMVMKRLRAEHWGRLLRRPELLPEEAAEDPLAWHLDVLLQVCEGLAYAHRVGLLHLDLKPSNVMVGRFGEVWIIDWGTARGLPHLRLGGVPPAAPASTYNGTPSCSPPELAPGSEAPTERSDVYLLGGLLYRLLGGGAPNGTGRPLDQLAIARSGERPWPEDAPQGLVVVARRAMSPDPRDRYPSVAVFRQAVLGWLRRRGAEPLARAATEQLDALVDLVGRLEAERRGPEPGERALMHRSYGEVSFGLRQAARLDPFLPDVERRQREAALALARGELAAERADAAEAALALAGEPPADLVARIERLRARQAAAEQEVRALRADRDERDPRVGAAARGAMLAALGVAWLLQGAIAQLAPQTQHFELLLFTDAALLAIVAALTMVLRLRLPESAFNRQAVALVAATLAGRILLVSAAHLLGLSSVEGWTMATALNAITLIVSSVMLNPWLLASALAWALAAVAGALWPDWVPGASALAAAALLVNVAVNQALLRRGRVHGRLV